MKKILMCLTCLALMAGTMSASAENKIGLAFDQGFGVTGQFAGFNAFIGNDGISGDYIFRKGYFTKDIPVNWYVAGGGYYNWGHDNTGARLPLGLTFPFAKSWDVFGMVAPVLDVDLDKDKANFELDFALGIRYQF